MCWHIIIKFLKLLIKNVYCVKIPVGLVIKYLSRLNLRHFVYEIVFLLIYNLLILLHFKLSLLVALRFAGIAK